MKAALVLVEIGAIVLLLGLGSVRALDPSLDVSQYAHTAWTRRDGFSVGAVFAMAQTPDGYLWLGSETGLYRFDGIHAVLWLPAEGQPFRSAPFSLLVTRDGTLWIGTFAGLLSWNGKKLIEYSEIGDVFITSLREDREGTVWAGIMFDSRDKRKARLCSVRTGQVQCYGEDGVFGSFVWSLGEDNAGNFWAGAESGLWRWKPGAPKHYLTEARVTDMAEAGNGALTFGIDGAGLKQVVADKLEPVPIYSPRNRKALLLAREIDTNKLLRDRDGGLWIGTHDSGLIHVHNGRTDVFRKSDGLSGDTTCSLFEDHEGNIWFASSQGLDRFRELPVSTISAKQGLSTDATLSVAAAPDGSIWAGTDDGMNRWNDGNITIFRKGTGLPDNSIQSLFQDHRGRLWAYTARGLVYFENGKAVLVNGVPSTSVFSITGDDADNLWLSGNKGLSHLRNGKVVETFPWPGIGRRQEAKVVLFDPIQGGIWLAFWIDGGVLYFKDGQVLASYTSAHGLGKGAVYGLQLDSEGALWVATQGGLSRIKDGHVVTMSSSNGLPCDWSYWSMEDNDHSLWLNTHCGLVRVTRKEVKSWVADPKRRIQMTVWDATEGVSPYASDYNPAVVKSQDGRLWVVGEGIAVVNPHRLAFNKVPPPVHIEQMVADKKTYWQNMTGTAAEKLRLSPRIHDLVINYAALSLVAPEKVHYKYKLEGQDTDWREVVNVREVHYSNLPPGPYRFRVVASNNSGVWNEQGDTLEFSVAPAYYQTIWFRALCAVLLLMLVWAIHRIRVRQLRHQFALTLEARVRERTSIARDLHDTLLQSGHGLLLRLQIISQLLPDRPLEAKEQIETTIDRTAQAITEGRDTVQGLRASTVQTNDLAQAINTLGEELATERGNSGTPEFRVTVEGESRNLHPILRDEIYRIAGEALQNAFNHARAGRIEVEVRYDAQQFRLRVRDDGKGIDQAVLLRQGREGHYGLSGMRERAKLAGGDLTVWSEVGAGTEVELRLPAATAYAVSGKRSWLSELLARR